MQNVEDRLTAFECRVAELEQAIFTQPDPSLAGSPGPDSDGTVSFGGDVTLPSGTYKYEWIRPVTWVSDHSWDDAMYRIAALAHPVRGAILRHLLATPASVNELVESGLISSTGTAYHHLKELQAAGWVTKKSGAFEIPAARVVPLMAIVIAGEDH